MAKAEDIEALLKKTADRIEELDKSSRAERDSLKAEVEALKKELVEVKKRPEPVKETEPVPARAAAKSEVGEDVGELAKWVKGQKVKTEETEKKRAERIRVRTPVEDEEAVRGLFSKMLKDIQDERS